MTSGYRIIRWHPTQAEAEALDIQCFPYDPRWWNKAAVWWLARAPDGSVAGYAAVMAWKPDHAAFLARVGVLPSHQGKGLQRRLIRARVRWAKSQGLAMAYTYTLPHNPASSINLIREGFLPFWPTLAWGGDTSCYWILRLKRPAK